MKIKKSKVSEKDGPRRRKEKIRVKSDKDENVSLAKFEKTFKRKKFSEKRTKSKDVDESERLDEEIVKKKKQKISFPRCSKKEFMKFWHTFVGETLTAVEADECEFKSQLISATNNDDKDYNEFLADAVSGWHEFLESDFSENGCPFVMFLCSSAQRCVNLNRDIAQFKEGKKCRTAKLFAKHMKVAEQEKFLKSQVVHAAIGTPSRIKTLIDSGCLNLTNLHSIVIDWANVDAKKRRLIDIAEIRSELFSLVKMHFVPLSRSKNQLSFILL